MSTDTFLSGMVASLLTIVAFLLLLVAILPG